MSLVFAALAARVLGAEGELGTIEVGNYADLVILDADPLSDIRNTRRIWRVIKGGRLVNREAMRLRPRSARAGSRPE